MATEKRDFWGQSGKKSEERFAVKTKKLACPVRNFRDGKNGKFVRWKQFPAYTVACLKLMNRSQVTKTEPSYKSLIKLLVFEFFALKS